MSELTKVRSVLAVKDLSAAVAFYREILGFAIDAEYDGWCFVSRGALQIMLGHCPDEIPASQINDHSYFAYIEVDEVDDLYQEFVANGLTELTLPVSQPWGMREFMVTTPDGHRMMFGQNLEE